MSRFILFFLLIGLSAISLPSRAETPAAPSVTLTDLANYFDQLTTLESLFTQIAADGRRAQGHFSYRKPGLMRFEFHSPSRQIMIAGETWLSLQDAPGEEANRYPLSASPLGRFLQSGARLDQTPFFTKLTRFVDQIIIMLRDPAAPDDGVLELVFRHPEIELIGWRVHDAQNQTTEIILSDITHPDALPMRLFVPQEDDIFGDR